MGKLLSEELQKILQCIKKTSSVAVSPRRGFDSGVHLLDDDHYLVVSSDPCIGVPENWFGWLLINYAASDVALFGAKPEFCTITLLGPQKTSIAILKKIMKQVCDAADELNIAIVTGHTGRYSGLLKLTGVCTAYGRVKKDNLITPAGAVDGDCIICTKPIGLETVVNFSLTHEKLSQRLFSKIRTLELQKLVKMQTCVEEAKLLATSGVAHAMHDITEGGFIASLNEMADLSKLGFTIESDLIPIPTEVVVLQRYFALSFQELLSMSSTGTLLAAVNPKRKDGIIIELQKIGINATSIGRFTKSQERFMIKANEKTLFPQSALDPYAKIVT